MSSFENIRVAVGVASVGRPSEIADLLKALDEQSSRPELVVLSVESAADLPPLDPAKGAHVIMGPKGLCAQRNRIIDFVAPQCDVIVFFDDDYIPSLKTIERLKKLFFERADIVGATGVVLADGVRQGGLPLDHSLDVLERNTHLDEEAIVCQPSRGAYGCNMAFRVSSIGSERFDEVLPLYGWQEDNDFAGRMSRVGPLAKTNAMIGVHRGVSRGRTSGLRLGYSQIANPIYIARKGAMAPAYAFRLMLNNFLMNHFRAFWPEAHVDRKGRARGNRIALMHVLQNKMSPEKMLDL